MDDLTLLYYTANTIKEDCAIKIRYKLLEVTGGKIPIVSVSQKPINFGDIDICIGEIGQSAYNCYKQIYEAVRHARTPYVACVEDDAIYNMEHFSHRPSKNEIVSYNSNMWFCEKDSFWRRHGHDRLSSGMFGCIAHTSRLLSILEARFEMWPSEPLPDPDTPPDRWDHFKKRIQSSWQEPGRYDRSLGTPMVDVEYFETAMPIVILNRHGSLGGRRKNNNADSFHVNGINGIGNCRKVWDYYMEDSKVCLT